MAATRFVAVTLSNCLCRVNGAALPLNGTDGTLSSTEPVVLQGSVTSEDGAVLLGPGLVYLDGAVQDGKGTILDA